MHRKKTCIGKVYYVEPHPAPIRLTAFTIYALIKGMVVYGLSMMGIKAYHADKFDMPAIIFLIGITTLLSTVTFFVTRDLLITPHAASPVYIDDGRK